MDKATKFQPGDKVKKNPETWEHLGEFEDFWDVGKGIGVVVEEEPDCRDMGLIDVRCLTGICKVYERCLLPAEEE